MANSSDFKLLASITTTGTLWSPAFCAACHLLSPATISNLSIKSSDFLTTIGWMIPLSLIELVNSSRLSFSNFFLGGYLFLIV